MKKVHANYTTKDEVFKLLQKMDLQIDGESTSVILQNPAPNFYYVKFIPGLHPQEEVNAERIGKILEELKY